MKEVKWVVWRILDAVAAGKQKSSEEVTVPWVGSL